MTVLDLEIAAQQPGLDPLNGGQIAATHTQVRGNQIPQHLLEQVIQIGAGRDAGQEGLIAFFGRFQIQTMVIEDMVAFHAPRLVIHLCPFLARGNFYLNA